MIQNDVEDIQILIDKIEFIRVNNLGWYKLSNDGWRCPICREFIIPPVKACPECFRKMFRYD